MFCARLSGQARAVPSSRPRVRAACSELWGSRGRSLLPRRGASLPGAAARLGSPLARGSTARRWLLPLLPQFVPLAVRRGAKRGSRRGRCRSGEERGTSAVRLRGQNLPPPRAGSRRGGAQLLAGFPEIRDACLRCTREASLLGAKRIQIIKLSIKLARCLLAPGAVCVCVYIYLCCAFFCTLLRSEAFPSASFYLVMTPTIFNLYQKL